MDLQPGKPVTTLTPRELSVVRLLGSGCSYGQVAERLGISPHTVVTHIKNAYRKLEVHTAAAAVMRAVQLGLLEVAGMVKS
jgi:DNA-binding CsgD family transcriptional regulator